MESSIEGPICVWAKDDGWHVRKTVYPGRRGAPDRYFLKGGRSVWIEFKDTGKPATLQQELERHRIIAHGGEAYLVDTLEEACRILGLQWPRATNKRVSTARSVRSISGPSS